MRRQRTGARGFATRYAFLGHLLGRSATRQPIWMVLGCTLVFALLALGMGKAAFSTDYRIFFSKEDPGLAAFEKLESTFTKTDNVLFVVHANDGSIFTPDGLAAIEEISADALTIPFAGRVDSLTNFPTVEADGDDMTQHPLVASPPSALGPDALAKIERRAMGEVMLLGSLVARDARTGAVNVTIRLPRQDPNEVALTANAARAIARNVNARHPGLTIRPCGMAFMNDAFMQASVSDLALLVPLMVVVMLVAMWFFLRSVFATIGVAVVLAFSSALSMAIAGWLKYPLTPPTVTAPMMVLTVAIADGIHVVLTAMDALRDGRSKRDAITYSISSNLEAITYTWLTTIVGFLCLNYSDAAPVRQLANMTAFGVTFAFLFSITLLPALLTLMPLAASRPDSERNWKLIDRLGRFVQRRRNYVLAAAAIVTVLAGSLAAQLRTNDQFVQYFGPSIEFRQNAEFTMKHLSGIYRLEIQVPSGSTGGILEPTYLKNLDAFTAWLRAQPEVDHAYSLTDVMKRVNQASNGDRLEAYSIPDTRAAVSETLFLYELGLPPGLDLRDRVDVEKSSTRVSLTVKDMSTRDMMAFKDRAGAWLRDHAPGAMAAEATGPVVIFSELSGRNANSMVQGDFVSLALISLCMMLVLRSARLGLLSIIPNVVPIVIGYGAWRLAVGEMNIVASIAGSISLGVIVDDTIHFLTKYKSTLAHEPSATVAMRKTLAAVAPAMLSTTIVLVAGFGVLTLSSFQMTAHLGWLSLLVVGVAPVADLVLVPALVLLIAPRAASAEDSNISPLSAEAGVA